MAKRPSIKRIKCCVPFCNRTAPADHHIWTIEGETFTDDEIICGIHWRLADDAVRRCYSRARRRLRKTELERYLIVAHLAYRKAKRQIIPRAGGA